MARGLRQAGRMLFERQTHGQRYLPENYMAKAGPGYQKKKKMFETEK